MARLKDAANWVADHELWLLAVVVPVLMASNRLPSHLIYLGLFLVPIPWLCRWVGKGYLSVRTPLDLPIILLMFTVIVSLYASVDLSLSILGVHKVIAEIALFYGLVNGVRSEKWIWLIAGLLLVAGSIASMVSLAIMQRSSSGLPFANLCLRYLPQLKGKWVPPNPNYVAGTLMLFFPLALSLLLFSSKKAYKLWIGVSSVIIGFSLLLTQSRSAFIGTAIALLALGVWRSRWFLCGIPLMATLLFLIARYLGIEQLVGPLSIMEAAGSGLQARLELWQRAIYVIQDFPYTGISLNTFDLVIPVLYPCFLLSPDARAFHAHNLYLQMAVELGIPGFIAFNGLLIVFAAITREVLSCSIASKDLQALAIGLFGGLLGHLVYGFTDAITLANKTGTFIWTIMGLMVAIWLNLKARHVRLTDRITGQ